MTRTLVLGSAGMLGHMVVEQLLADGHSVTALQRRASTEPHIVEADVLDFVGLDGFLRQREFDAVVNCVGILNRTSHVDPPLTVLTNSYLPQWLGVRAPDYSFRLVHISTDCVFSGETGPYSEHSPPDAQDLYGRTKALGELWDNPS